MTAGRGRGGELAAALGVDGPALGATMADLARRRLTVATAESLTGGLLSALLTEVPGSSAVFRGGLIVYATDLKHELAGVDAELLGRRGPVDPDVALQLASGARRRCGASIGLGLTGVAGPDPQGGVAVGTFFVAAAGPDGHQLIAHHPEPGDNAGGVNESDGRAAVRAAAVRVAVDLLRNLSEGPLENPARDGDVSPTADAAHPGGSGCAE